MVSQKERIVFQPSIFRGKLAISFREGNISPENCWLEDAQISFKQTVVPFQGTTFVHFRGEGKFLIFIVEISGFFFRGLGFSTRVLGVFFFANSNLVGGFNPSEKYARQIGSFPQFSG